MRRVAVLLVSLGLILSMLPSAVLAAPEARASQAVIVVFNDSVADPAAAAADLGRQHAFGIDFVYRHALRGFAAAVPAGRLEGLSHDPRVAWVEPDQAVQLYEQTVPTGVERIFAPGNPEITIDGTDDLRVDADIAIIDTGIDLDHPDLNVYRSTTCLIRSGGGPFASYSCGAGGDDDNDHGSHVAGSAAALDNGIGVVGVAPGARLWAVKVLDANGSGSLSAVTAGIDYVTANAGEIEVANMSLGCECTSAAMDTAIANSVAAGVTYAVAAGNSDADASTHSPANHPSVITVSALADFNGQPGGGVASTCRADVDDTLADFSNFGATVEIAAPGVCILSTVPGGGYDTFSGTSMASPHVAGAAALLAASASYTPDAIRTTLIAEGNLDWTDDSGDGIQERLLDVSDSTVFNPATVAGSGSGGGEGSFSLDLSGTSATQGKNNWAATVTIAASDGASSVSGVAVTGSWSNGGTASCTTGASGTCTVSRSQHKRVASVTFSVTSASHGSLTWDGGPDSVTVTKP